MKRKEPYQILSLCTLIFLMILSVACSTRNKDNVSDTDSIRTEATEPGKDSLTDNSDEETPKPPTSRYMHILHGEGNRFYVTNFNFDEKGKLTLSDDWGVIDINGKVIVDGKKKILIHDGNYNFINDQGFVKYYEEGKGFGVMDRNFKEVIPARYSNLDLYNQYAVYSDSTSMRNHIIEVPSKKEVGNISMKDYKIMGISEGMVKVCRNDKLLKEGICYVDLKGNVIIPNNRVSKFDVLGDFSDGYALVMEGNKPYYIDRNGKIIISLDKNYNMGDYFAYNNAGFYYFKGGFAVAADEKDYYIINKQGKKVNNCKIKCIEEYDNDKLAATIISKGKEKKVIMDRSGHILDSYKPISAGDDWKIVYEGDSSISGKVGYKDAEGKMRLPIKYGNNSTEFRNGYAIVAIDGIDGYCVIDTKGKILLKNIALSSRFTLPG